VNKFITLFAGTLAVALLGIFAAATARASGMSMAPLEYKTSLKQDEYKKGYVDIVNPDAAKVDVQLEVQAFKQVDSSGGLEFYNDDVLKKGIQLDLSHIELGPNEGARIYFQLDADKLPSGDVFAAILAGPSLSKKNVQTIPSARAGTLLMIENGTPPPHHAEVNSLQTNFWQFGDKIQARFEVKNTDPAGGKALGFIPKIDISLAPYSKKTIDGPLVFAGNTREVAYSQPGSYFGPMVVRASIDGHASSRLVFAITGYWRWLAPVILCSIVVIIFVFNRILQNRRP